MGAMGSKRATQEGDEGEGGEDEENVTAKRQAPRSACRGGEGGGGSPTLTRPELSKSVTS